MNARSRNWSKTWLRPLAQLQAGESGGVGVRSLFKEVRGSGCREIYIYIYIYIYLQPPPPKDPPFLG